MVKNNFIQEIFNLAAVHLLKQNEKCLSLVTGEPRYQYNGKKCPGRLFIHEYKRKYEGYSILGLEAKFHIFSDWGYIEEEISFMNRIQVLHDSIPVNEWKKTLIELAKKFNLSIELIKDL